MIREVLAEAWARSPRQLAAAVLLTPVAVLGAWAALVVFLVACGTAS